MTIDLSPIIISLRTATLSIIVTFFLGVAAAQLVFRLKSKTMKTILDGLFTLPLVLPPTVAGFFFMGSNCFSCGCYLVSANVPGSKRGF